MADRKTKKEIRKVIRKYGLESSRDTLKAAGLLSSGLVGAGVLMDLAVTGGLFSIGMAILGACGGTAAFIGTGAAVHNSIARDYVNAAGQTLRCNPVIHDTLQEMQSRLQKSFKKASTPKTKKKFMRLAAEVEADARTLSSAFNITAGGPNGHGTDRYVFIADPDEETTLAEAIRKLSQPEAPKPLTPEEEIRLLKERLSKLENPGVTKLDKPSHPPSP